MEQKNIFLVNHVGYPCTAVKKLVYLGSAEEFTVYRLRDLVLSPVYTGKLTYHSGGEILHAKAGDFSSVMEPGIYRIATKEGNSRCFIIDDRVYEPIARLAAEFFTWQRCNSDFGWHGNCHTQDSIRLKNGEIRFLGKGHHQSSDLRKWTYGTSLGMVGYAEYALREKPLWDHGIRTEEMKHSADYFLSLIMDDGALIDCTWVPEGYNEEKMRGVGFGNQNFPWHSPRMYFESPCPEAGHWNAIRELALVALNLGEKDPEYAGKCLEGAKKIWNYLEGPGKKLNGYKIPVFPPLGHDGIEKYFKGFYEESALRHGSRAAAAQTLYRVTKEEVYYHASKESLRKLAALKVGGNTIDNPAAACYYESGEAEGLANNYIYFFCTTIPQAYAGAIELWPDDKETAFWLESARNIADQLTEVTQRNPFGRSPGSWYIEGNDVFETPGCFSFSTNEKPAFQKFQIGTARPQGEEKAVWYDYNSFCFNLDLLANGVFLAKMGRLTNNPRYREAAQRQLDWILGLNPFDASNVEGVGYNHPHRGIFGEFFPPVPQIPGGVYTGITEESFSMEAQGYDCEYDMPMAGWLLYLLAELVK
jgi:hypothetical protein